MIVLHHDSAGARVISDIEPRSYGVTLNFPSGSPSSPSKSRLGNFRFIDDAGIKDVFARERVALHRRTQVAGVLDEKAGYLFINGRLQASSKRDGNIKSSIFPFLIGARPPKYAASLVNPFFGVIDELRVSKVARYTTDFTPQARFEPDADTLALYHFDEGAGDILTDSSGHNHHGKIITAKWIPGIAK